MTKTTKSYHYDPKRSASVGRWVIVRKGKTMVKVDSVHTEREARKACGLDGGSTDPWYRPDSAA